MQIDLTKYKVTTKDELLFGDMEDVQMEIGNESNLLKGNAKLTEVAVVSILDNDNNEVKYSNEWRRNLSIVDGTKLSQEIQKLISGIEQEVKKA